MKTKRNHQKLWEQLKVLIIYSGKKRYTRRELYDLMLDLEYGQLVQDPISELEKIGGSMSGKETI